MAVYNGDKYVLQQISSILCQLNAGDELIVIDDCSTDSTVSLIQSVPDPRIKLSRNPRNLGVFKSFENAVNLSAGEIIFLSDQDDLWHKTKVAKIISAFDLNSEVTMIATDATVIDGDGAVRSESFFAGRGAFKAGLIDTIVKNKYLGCTLAFRKSLKDILLPIPADVPMHDIWFGAMNATYGKTYFIDEPLISYRRHADNVSPESSSNSRIQAYWRYLLVKNILKRVYSLRGRGLFSFKKITFLT